MNMAGYHEVEIKLRVANVAAVRRRLALARARPTANGRVHEMNVLFDTPQGGFAKQGQLLRLRVERASGKVGKGGGAAKERAVLTYKGPAIKNTSGGNGPRKRYKMREEVEVGVADPERLRLKLKAGPIFLIAEPAAQSQRFQNQPQPLRVGYANLHLFPHLVTLSRPITA